jgi:RimJ/RimL family protein N-acetyltransferase
VSASRRPVRGYPADNGAFTATLYLVLGCFWVLAATLGWLDDDATPWLSWAFTVLAVGYAGLAVLRWRKVRRERQAPPPTGVELRPVDEAVLARLIGAALSGAEPDEVTPPVPSAGRWGPERIEWLRRFHRDRRMGLDGPLGEATWAVASDGEIVGAVRLKRTAEPGVLETGIWLGRHARGRSIGRQAVAAVLDRARGMGAREVRADTSRDNAAALYVLQRSGFRTTDEGDRVVAVRRLGSGTR